MAIAPAAYHSDKIPAEVQICDARSGGLRMPALSMPAFTHALAFSPDGETLAVGCLGVTKLLDPLTGQVRHDLRERSCPAKLVFSPDSHVLAVRYRGGWNGSGSGVRLWNTATGEALGDFHSLANEQPLEGMYFVDQGATLLVLDTAERRLVRLDARSGLGLDSIPLTGKPIGLVLRSDVRRAAICYAGGFNSTVGPSGGTCNRCGQ